LQPKDIVVTRLTRFVLVDLYDQAAFIAHDIRTPPERFLAWLWRFGKAGGMPVFGEARHVEAYALRSVTGLESSFWFDDEGELHVGRDADVFRRVFPRSLASACAFGVFSSPCAKQLAPKAVGSKGAR
jgi:hypothetical protein